LSIENAAGRGKVYLPISRLKKQGVAVGIHRAPDETIFDIEAFTNTPDGENTNV
jgi:hypothetical protein